jgi:hypothetical protein
MTSYDANEFTVGKRTPAVTALVDRARPVTYGDPQRQRSGRDQSPQRR